SRAIITLSPMIVVLEIILNAPIPERSPRQVSEAKTAPFSIFTFSPHDLIISFPQKARIFFAPKLILHVDSGNLAAKKYKPRPTNLFILCLSISILQSIRYGKSQHGNQYWQCIVN